MEMTLLRVRRELDLEELYNATESTKYLALGSCVFLLCETFQTIPAEVRLLWRSRWSFGRIMFHANRVWGPLMLAIYVPTLFMYNLSEEVCIAAWWFYIYASIIAQVIVASVLIARIWAIYEMKTWVLVALCLVSLVVSSPSIIILQLQATQSNFLKNPAPDLISGCPTKLNALAFVPYLPPFLSETFLFIMTVYKPWKISRTRMSTPLMTKLIRNGSQYYVIVLGALIFVVIGSVFPPTNHAVNGSGLLTAVWSSMCTRLILSGRSWHARENNSSSAVEMTELPVAWRSGSREIDLMEYRK
ncbi:hypothetical protein BDV93DRAFT_548507 [Ceratobasidium sp. AG-I]|nr:hypothetical protein BDV93DRAFT_548507 [Ceratobasidium sp. AG-I]